MDFLQSLLDNSSIPAITAFILGILTSVSPCPLATNITAIGFISKDIENRHRIFINGLLYTFGRIVSYTVLGFILIPILREGASMFMVQKAVSKYVEMLIAPALIIIGIFMLDIIKLNLPKINIGGESLKKRTKGGWGGYAIGYFIRPCFLSYQWSILFRYAYAFVSSGNGRVSLTCNLRHCYGITRNPCCMDFSVQCCRTG